MLNTRPAVPSPHLYTLRRLLAPDTEPAEATESHKNGDKLAGFSGSHENPTRVYIYRIDASLFALHGGEELGAWLRRSRARVCSRLLGAENRNKHNRWRSDG